MFISSQTKSLKARRLMCMGMMFTAIAIAFPHLFHSVTSFAPDFMDGLRGLFFGIAIGLNLLGVHLACRKRHSSEN
jgi:hypothetical protein